MIYSIPSLKLPKSVPNSPDEFYKIPVEVRIYSDEIGENGESIVIGEYKGLCNYQEKATRVFTDNTVTTKVIGNCEFNSDILPNIPTVHSGELTIFGNIRTILNCTKFRDNDGNVFATKFEVE